ncbi:MAG: rRNA maturation RNase YbeY [Treponema sp.]|nr:rRNA maturation RNase YbeY [Treponema sp.]
MNNNVTISFEGIANPQDPEKTKTFILEVLERLGKHHWDLSIFFCNNEIIRKLNNQYRNLDESTDVLSFVMGEMAGERFLPGDIVISLEKTEENSKEFGCSPKEELHRLLIHGILHLVGMDHSSNDDSEEMLMLQEKLLAEISQTLRV